MTVGCSLTLPQRAMGWSSVFVCEVKETMIYILAYDILASLGERIANLITMPEMWIVLSRILGECRLISSLAGNASKPSLVGYT